MASVNCKSWSCQHDFCGHGRPRRRVTPVVSVATTPATDGQIFTDFGGREDAFVSSRLDYCNSLLYGISDGLLSKLQTVQNTAARVVTGTRKFDHITPVLHQLHWLPVRHLQVGYDHLQVPSWSGAILLG